MGIYLVYSNPDISWAYCRTILTINGTQTFNKQPKNVVIVIVQNMFPLAMPKLYTMKKHLTETSTKCSPLFACITVICNSPCS